MIYLHLALLLFLYCLEELKQEKDAHGLTPCIVPESYIGFERRVWAL